LAIAILIIWMPSPPQHIDAKFEEVFAWLEPQWNPNCRPRSVQIG
jgi:hypothetical protein